MPIAPTVKDFKLLYLWHLKKDSLPYFKKLHDQYGDVFHKNYKGADHYYFRNPQCAEHILSKNQGNYRKHSFLSNALEPFIGKNNLFTTINISQWHRDRTLAKAAFEKEVHFDRYVEVMTRKCDMMLNEWERRLHAQSKTIFINTEMDELILSIVSNTVFYDIDIDIKLLAKRVPKILNMTKEKNIALTQLNWILPTKTKRQYKEYINFTRASAIKIICSRLESRKDYDDLLGILLNAYKITDKDSPEFIPLCNHIVLYNMVGYLTSAAALCWTLVLLSEHPEVAQRIAEEISTVCHDNPPTYSDFAKLTYTQAVISEVLRFYPPIAYLLREAIGADEIMGYPIQPDDSLLINVFLLHRHPNYWNNPEQFYPERFLEKRWGQDYQYAYIPFGAGKRSCLARNFAFLEVCLVIAMICRRFQLSLPKGEKVKINYSSNITIRPSVKKMFLQKRK